MVEATSFFRDSEVFDYLREHVLPDLLAAARGRGNGLRLWSAGSGVGQEAYSLAMLVADALGDELTQLNVRVFATEVDAGAIEAARRGIYTAADLDAIPRHLAERYFTPVGDGTFEIVTAVRSMMVFGQYELGRRAPSPNIDLCICRDVLSHFTSGRQNRALQVLALSLRNEGVLVLGKSESISPPAEYFSSVQPALGVYRRQGERLLNGSARFGVASWMPEAHSSAGTGRTPSVPPEYGSRDELARSALEQPIGIVVVNRRYDIQTLNGAAARLLGLHDVTFGEDLIHQVRHVPAASPLPWNSHCETAMASFDGSTHTARPCT